MVNQHKEIEFIVHGLYFHIQDTYEKEHYSTDFIGVPFNGSFKVEIFINHYNSWTLRVWGHINGASIHHEVNRNSKDDCIHELEYLLNNN